MTRAPPLIPAILPGWLSRSITTGVRSRSGRSFGSEPETDSELKVVPAKEVNCISATRQPVIVHLAPEFLGRVRVDIDGAVVDEGTARCPVPGAGHAVGVRPDGGAA